MFDLRRVSILFTIIFVVEILVFAVMFLWVYSITIEDPIEQARIFSRLLAGFGSVLLTSGLLYHSFWQRPELAMMDIVIDPLDAREKNIAEPDYIRWVFSKDPNDPKGYIREPYTSPKKRNRFLEVRSTSEPAKIRISFDVCNVGISETTIHEYTVKEVKPTERLVGNYSNRQSLSHQKRITLDFVYPDQPGALLRGGEFEFNIVVIGSTARKSRRFGIFISSDLKTIRWQKIDC